MDEKEYLVAFELIDACLECDLWMSFDLFSYQL